MHTHLFCCVSLAKSINQKEKVDMYLSGIFQKAGCKQLCAGRVFSALSFWQESRDQNGGHVCLYFILHFPFFKEGSDIIRAIVNYQNSSLGIFCSV